MEEKKKSTYNKKAQDKYKKTRKKFICDMPADEGEKVKAHYTQKGYTSANSYILTLIRADMSTAAESVGAAPDDTPTDC